MKENIPRVLSVSQMAQKLGICRNTAYKLVKSGKIRSIRIGRAIRIPESALLDYINSSG